VKPVAESSKAADTERFERAVGVWKPADQRKGPACEGQPQEKEVTSTNTTDHHVSSTRK